MKYFNIFKMLSANRPHLNKLEESGLGTRFRLSTSQATRHLTAMSHSGERRHCECLTTQLIGAHLEN